MLSKFTYVAAENFKAASDYLTSHLQARPILGGTDLLVQLEKRIIQVSEVVDLSEIPGIDAITETDDFYVMGAGVVHAQLEEWAAAHPEYAAIGQAAASIGTPQVRNIATWVGNLCNAVPSADMGAPSLVFDAVLQVIGQDGQKNIPVKNFFTGPKRTVLTQGELVVSISVPKVFSRTRSCYRKFGPRNASDLALVGVGVKVTLDEKDLIEDIKIGLAAVAPAPTLAPNLERLRGMEPNEDAIAFCVRSARDCAKPITDFRATAEYRREMVAVETEKAVRACFEGFAL